MMIDEVSERKGDDRKGDGYPSSFVDRRYPYARTERVVSRT